MNAKHLGAVYTASQQPRRPTRRERFRDWFDLWGVPTAMVFVLALVYLIPTLDAIAQAALRSCGL